MALDWLLRPILVSLTLLLGFVSSASSLTEAEALLQLKKSFIGADALASWVAGSGPCKPEPHWRGVVCTNGLVSGLRLEHMGLSGTIDVGALTTISGLRSVSFAYNSFSGSIPELNRLGSLKAMFLTGNQFSGSIPQDFFSRMLQLKKVWLASNNFTGTIPSSLASLPHLIELRLENNQFVGAIPFFSQPTLMSFNVSNNNLVGEIPPSLARFNTTSFDGNPGLCEDPSMTCTTGSGAGRGTTRDQSEQNHGGTKNILVGLVALLVLVICVVAVVTSKRQDGRVHDVGTPDALVKSRGAPAAVEVQVAVPTKPVVEMQMTKKPGSSRRGSNRGGMTELVMVNDEKGGFGLSDLMKASAEVLGNGGLGCAYKATLANGVSVVVKRMREMNAMGRDGFSAEVRKLGLFRHPNILTPLAFHYRKDEKLLIYAFVPKGSLQYMMHGDRGPSHAELDWPARLKIVHGIARGLEYLHTELASYPLPHGNLKSSNVLLGPDNEPLLSEYGFHPLVSSLTSTTLASYKAPEVVHVGVSRKCDVYCLGIIILEILTGKFPSQYLNKAKGGTDVVLSVESAIPNGTESEVLDPEIFRSATTTTIDQMKKLLHIGAACAEANPDYRLDLGEAVRRIQEIRSDGGGAVMQAIPPHWDGLTDTHLQDASMSRGIQGDFYQR